MRLPWAAVVTLASGVVQRCVFLGIALFATRSLGTAEFGRFALGYAFAVNIGQVLADPLAVAAGVSRGLGHEPAFLRAAAFAGVTIAALTVLAAPVLSMWSGGGLVGVYLMAALLLAIQIPANVLAAVLYTFEKPISVGVINVLVSLGVLASAIAASKAGHAELLLVVMSFGAALQLALFAFLTRRSVLVNVLTTRAIGSLPWKPTILPTAGSIALSTPVHFVCLAILASSTDGLHQTALFSTLFVVASLFTFVPAGLRALLLPELADGAARRNSTRVLLASTVGSAVLISALVAAFSGHLLRSVGEAFAGQHVLLINICIAGTAMALTHVINYLMWSKSRSKAIFLVSLAYAVIYISAAYYFVAVKSQGAEGLSKSLVVATLFQLAASAAVQMRGRNA